MGFLSRYVFVYVIQFERKSPEAVEGQLTERKAGRPPFGIES